LACPVREDAPNAKCPSATAVGSPGTSRDASRPKPQPVASLGEGESMLFKTDLKRIVSNELLLPE
jgi:hypothetical protein